MSKGDLLTEVCHRNGYSSSVLASNHFQKVRLVPSSHWLIKIQRLSNFSYNFYSYAVSSILKNEYDISPPHGPTP